MNLPNINDFLSVIDPRKSIDRDKAAAEIGLIITLQTLNNMAPDLPEDVKNQIQAILSNQDELLNKPFLPILEKAGLLDKFKATMEETAQEIVKDYLQNHLKNTSEEMRQQLLAKWPDLSELV